MYEAKNKPFNQNPHTENLPGIIRKVLHDFFVTEQGAKNLKEPKKIFFTGNPRKMGIKQAIRLVNENTDFKVCFYLIDPDAKTWPLPDGTILKDIQLPRRHECDICKKPFNKNETDCKNRNCIENMIV